MAIQWLKEAGLIHKVYNITAPKMPLAAYSQHEYFKIYCSDVGLLGAKANLSAHSLLLGSELLQAFKGALTENFVVQTLMRLKYQGFYWCSQGKAEVDFIIQHAQHIFPLEVKSGQQSKKQSLRVYEQKFAPTRCLRASPMNLKLDGQVMNIPLYLLDELQRLLSLAQGESISPMS